VVISQSKRPLHNHLFLSYLIIAIQNHTSGWPSHSHPNTEILTEISLLPTGDPYYVSYSLIKETKNAKRLVHCIHLEASMGLRILPMVLHLLAAIKRSNCGASCSQVLSQQTTIWCKIRPPLVPFYVVMYR
jgi:hypothetical protein